MGRFLIVTWDGGGNVPPAIGLGRLLSARDHAVRILGQRDLRPRIEAAGCQFVALPPELEWDPSRGRAWEDQGQRPYARLLMGGLPVPEAMLAELDRAPADVLVVDNFLRTGMCAAEASRVPTAALQHTRYGFAAPVPNPWWDVEPVNEIRQRLGLEPLVPKDELFRLTLMKRCDRALAVIPREFEGFDGPLPANQVHVGPIFETAGHPPPDDLPWSADDRNPLVVVGFSTTYMHHEDLFNRILEALATLGLRVLATLGGGLEVHEVSAPAGIVVRPHVPHLAIFPYASLVITHAGMGTVMAAFAAGVPMLCVPLGRDQQGNAEQVERLGAGQTLGADASVDQIRTAVTEMLESPAIRTTARRMADVVAGYGHGRLAVEELEGLL